MRQLITFAFVLAMMNSGSKLRAEQSEGLVPVSQPDFMELFQEQQKQILHLERQLASIVELEETVRRLPIVESRFTGIESEVEILNRHIANESISSELQHSDDCPVWNPASKTCREGFWETGYAFVFAKPYFEDNVAFQYVTSVFEQVDYDFASTPRVWLMRGNRHKLGHRIRYWQFDEDSRQVRTQANAGQTIRMTRITLPTTGTVLQLFTPGINSSLQIATSLDVAVVDYEGVKTFQFFSSELDVFGGLRYARIDQSYHVSSVDGATVTTFDFTHHFEGVGPQIGLGMRQRVTDQILILSEARGAALFGEHDETFSAHGIISYRDAVIPVGEIHVGAEWASQIFEDFDTFVRCTFEGQYWIGAGKSSSSEGNLGFVGVGVSAGLTF